MKTGGAIALGLGVLVIGLGAGALVVRNGGPRAVAFAAAKDELALAVRARGRPVKGVPEDRGRYLTLEDATKTLEAIEKRLGVAFRGQEWIDLVAPVVPEGTLSGFQFELADE